MTDWYRFTVVVVVTALAWTVSEALSAEGVPAEQAVQSTARQHFESLSNPRRGTAKQSISYNTEIVLAAVEYVRRNALSLGEVKECRLSNQAFLFGHDRGPLNAILANNLGRLMWLCDFKGLAKKTDRERYLRRGLRTHYVSDLALNLIAKEGGQFAVDTITERIEGLQPQLINERQRLETALKIARARTFFDEAPKQKRVETVRGAFERALTEAHPQDRGLQPLVTEFIEYLGDEGTTDAVSYLEEIWEESGYLDGFLSTQQKQTVLRLIGNPGHIAQTELLRISPNYKSDPRWVNLQ